jgi:hypothetical protein
VVFVPGVPKALVWTLHFIAAERVEVLTMSVAVALDVLSRLGVGLAETWSKYAVPVTGFASPRGSLAARQALDKAMEAGRHCSTVWRLSGVRSLSVGRRYLNLVGQDWDGRRVHHGMLGELLGIVTLGAAAQAKPVVGRHQREVAYLPAKPDEDVRLQVEQAIRWHGASASSLQ